MCRSLRVAGIAGVSCNTGRGKVGIEVGARCVGTTGTVAEEGGASEGSFCIVRGVLCMFHSC